MYTAGPQCTSSAPHAAWDRRPDGRGNHAELVTSFVSPFQLTVIDILHIQILGAYFAHYV